MNLSPERLWWISTRLYRRGNVRLAKCVKALNFVLWHAVLPYECSLHSDVRLWHRGLGTVIHPNTRIGRGVVIGHGVTITAGSQEPGSELCVILEDGCVIGTGALVAPRTGQQLRIGACAEVGARAVVTRSVPARARMVGPKAVQLPERGPT